MHYLKLPINLILSSIFLSALFPNIVICVPSTKYRDHVPHPYKTNGNIIVLYVVTFSIINISERSCVVYAKACFVFLQKNKPVVTRNYGKAICQHLWLKNVVMIDCTQKDKALHWQNSQQSQPSQPLHLTNAPSLQQKIQQLWHMACDFSISQPQFFRVKSWSQSTEPWLYLFDYVWHYENFIKKFSQEF